MWAGALPTWSSHPRAVAHCQPSSQLARCSIHSDTVTIRLHKRSLVLLRGYSTEAAARRRALCGVSCGAHHPLQRLQHLHSVSCTLLGHRRFSCRALSSDERRGPPSAMPATGPPEAGLKPPPLWPRGKPRRVPVELTPPPVLPTGERPGARPKRVPREKPELRPPPPLPAAALQTPTVPVAPPRRPKKTPVPLTSPPQWSPLVRPAAPAAPAAAAPKPVAPPLRAPPARPAAVVHDAGANGAVAEPLPRMVPPLQQPPKRPSVAAPKTPEKASQEGYSGEAVPSASRIAAPAAAAPSPAPAAPAGTASPDVASSKPAAAKPAAAAVPAPTLRAPPARPPPPPPKSELRPPQPPRAARPPVPPRPAPAAPAVAPQPQPAPARRQQPAAAAAASPASSPVSEGRTVSSSGAGASESGRPENVETTVAAAAPAVAPPVQEEAPSAPAVKEAPKPPQKAAPKPPPLRPPPLRPPTASAGSSDSQDMEGRSMGASRWSVEDIQAQRLQRALELQQSGERFSVLVLRANAGGLVCQAEDDLRGFLPFSFLEAERKEALRVASAAAVGDLLAAGHSADDIPHQARIVAMAGLAGERLEVQVMKVERSDDDSGRTRVYLSERVAGEARTRGRRGAPLTPDVLEVLQRNIGATVEGTVINVTVFGSFLEFSVKDPEGGEVAGNGLVHRMEMSWDALEDARDVVQIGDVVSAVLTSVDMQTGRVTLSMRQTRSDPLLQTLQSLIGSEVGESEMGSEAAAQGNMREVEDVCAALNSRIEVLSAVPGRRLAARATAPEFQVYLARDAGELEEGTTSNVRRYKLVARNGLDVQEILVDCTVNRELMKAILAGVVARIA